MNNQLIEYKNQTGSALIVSLSILLVLTILGVSAMRTTSLEEKMAGNSRDAQVAFEAAEAALREGEKFIDDSLNDGAYVDSTILGAGLYKASVVLSADAWTEEAKWGVAIQVPYSTDVARLPRFMVQIVESKKGTGGAADLGDAYSYDEDSDKEIFYQITARGTGISPNSRAMLQSYYTK